MLIIGSKYRQIPQIPDLHVCSSVITPASRVKNLGVIMDDNSTMETHINNIMRAAFFKIHEISYYWRFLTPICAKTLIHADITSKLDYCNGLLYGLPSQQLNRLQSILNTAARLVTMTRKYDHITPILRDLDWLPVNFRLKFKLLLQVNKTLRGLAPPYLSSKLSLRPNKGLRSDNQLLLDVPKSTLQLKYYGDRAFSVAGPTLWNALPKEIRLCKSVDSFNSNLKTHFFKKAFAWLVEEVVLHGMQSNYWLCLWILLVYFSRLIAIILRYCLFTFVPFILVYIFLMIYCQESDYFMHDPIVYTCFYVKRWRTVRFGAI